MKNIPVLSGLLPKLSFFCLLIACFADPASCQDEYFRDSIYDGSIKTAMLRSSSWELSLPFIELNSDLQLELLFDDISDDYRQLSYTFIHCDDEWKHTVTQKQLYIRGFTENPLTEYRRSFNTTYDYINYRLVFPEQGMEPAVSGNYVIVVFETGNPERILLTKRFYVLEKAVNIIPQVKRPLPGPDYETGQLVNFSVTGNSETVNNPDIRITAIVRQNNRDDNAVRIKQPQFVRPGRLDYTFSDQVIFRGGNEFRSFDIKNLKYLSQNIAAIDFINPFYHVTLKTDESRAGKPYFFTRDLNGSFYVDRENSVDKNSEADYVYVHFMLDVPPSPDIRDIYVFGMLSDWKLNESNRMKFIKEKGLYELIMLVKQGWYEYEYVTVNDRGVADEDRLEGSHYETENSYAFFVYAKRTADDFTRLIGYASAQYP